MNELNISKCNDNETNGIYLELKLTEICKF